MPFVHISDESLAASTSADDLYVFDRLGSPNQTFKVKASSIATYVASTLSVGVTFITGTANQVLANGAITPQAGSVTLTTPQDIATTSSVQFGAIGINTAPSVSFDNAGISSGRNSYWHGAVIGSSGLAFGLDISLAITGTVSTASTVRIFPNLQTAIPTYKALEIANGSSSGAVTNAYHAYIEAPTYGSSSNAAIYGANFTTYTGVTPPTNGIAIQGNSIFKGQGITSGLNTSAPITGYAGTNSAADGISLQLSTTSAGPIALQFFNHSTATTANQGYALQSIAAGSSNKPLYLNPNGGGVSSGYLTAPGDGNFTISGTLGVGIALANATADLYQEYNNTAYPTLHTLGVGATISTWTSSSPTAGVTVTTTGSTNAGAISTDFLIGSRFTVASTIYVTHLGFLENASFSVFQSGSRTVGLYDGSGNLLASTSISSVVTSVGGIRYVALSNSVKITTGQTYTLIGTSPASQNVLTSGNTVTWASPITFVSTVSKSNQSSLVYYTGNDNSYSQGFGPGLLFAVSADILTVTNTNTKIANGVYLQGTLGVGISTVGATDLVRINSSSGTATQLKMDGTNTATQGLVTSTDQIAFNSFCINKCPASTTVGFSSQAFFYNYVDISNANAVVTRAAGVYVGAGQQISTTGSGSSITTGYALYVENAGMGTNRISVYLTNLSIGYAVTTPPATGAVIAGNVSIGSPTNTYKFDVTSGDIGIMTSGNTLRVQRGSNSCSGTGAVLVAGTVTVNTTAVATGDMVWLSRTATGGTPGSSLPVVTIVNGTSFTLTSSALDTSTYSWLITKAA